MGDICRQRWNPHYFVIIILSQKVGLLKKGQAPRRSGLFFPKFALRKDLTPAFTVPFALADPLFLVELAKEFEQDLFESLSAFSCDTHDLFDVGWLKSVRQAHVGDD